MMGGLLVTNYCLCVIKGIEEEDEEVSAIFLPNPGSAIVMLIKNLKNEDDLLVWVFFTVFSLNFSSVTV